MNGFGVNELRPGVGARSKLIGELDPGNRGDRSR